MKIKKGSFSILYVFLFLVLLVYAALMFCMIGWSFISSVKTQGDFTMYPLSFPKFGWHFDNYVKAFEAIQVTIPLDGGGYRIVYLVEMFGNSLLFSVGCAFMGTISPCVVAYLVAKYNKKFNHLLYAIVIFTMIVPIVGNLPSMLQVLKTLQLHNTIFGVYLMKGSFVGMYFLVFYAMFRGISWDYAEAAIIDGAGHFRIFFNIMVPLAKNTIGTVFILLFISYWNDYQTPLIYIPDMPTAAYGLYMFINGNQVSGELQTAPIQLAGGMVLLLPILVMFLLLKDKLMGNISVGGLKG